MKTRNENMRVSLLELAVQGTLLAMCAMPAHGDDEEVAELKNPTNAVEIGVSNTSRDSAKFGEYNGLNKLGVDFIGNISARGGDAYGDGNGTMRWGVTGTDLGLTSRELGATMSNQGQWDFGIGYDELRHNLADTYQTPFLGSMGGNSFALPAGFGLVSTAAVGTTHVGTDLLNAAQLAAFHPVDVAATRRNGSFTAGVRLNAQWDVKLDFNHLEQSGAKLMSFGSMAGGAVTGEVVSFLPNPTNYKTDTVNLALNFRGDKGHMTAAYFGSYFRDGYNGVTFETFIGANNTQTMSTPPGNDFHQLNLTGGYAFSPRTKLAGGLSYGRNTQNEAFAVDTISMVTPAPTASANALVRTTHADLKLTDQTTKDLLLSAGVKFDERNNRTASNFYNFNALDGAVNHQAIFPNTPYSNRKTLLELAGNYRLDKKQHIRLSYDHEDVKRWCDQYAVSVGVAPGAFGYYPAGINCVVATASKDDKLGATYKLVASEDVNLNVGYSYSKRRTDSDPNAITARIGANGNPDLTASPLIQGLNAGDFRGFYPWFDASRKEQMLEAGVNWQANDKLSLALGGRYTDDKYDSAYGVQKGNSWSMNLDATYGYSENGSISAYLTQQHRERHLTDLQRSPTLAAQAANTNTNAASIAIPSGASWTDKLTDDQTTVGVGAKQSGLMGAKLELTEDLTYSLGRTAYGTQLNYATTTSVASGSLTCSAPQILTCGDLPVIRNRLLLFKVTGKYQLDKTSRIALGYIYQQLKSDDYYYNALQYGFTPSALLPTNQHAPNYSVNVVTASYIYNF